MTQKDDSSNWLFDGFSSEELQEYHLNQKKFHEEWEQKERAKKVFGQHSFEVFESKNTDDLIQKALEGVPMILNDVDMKIVQKYVHKWLESDGNASLSEFDQAKNELTNQKNIGIFASIMNIISEAKSFQNNFLKKPQNMNTKTQNFQDENNNNLPTWFDEDVSDGSKELPEWLQPGQDYVPPTAESEEEFQKYIEARRRVVLHIYKYNGIKSVVDFLGAEKINEDFEDFRFFEQIARNDLKIIYQFAEKYMAMRTQKLEGKEKIQNEIERRDYYEFTKNVFSSPIAQNLLYFTRSEIDDIVEYL